MSDSIRKEILLDNFDRAQRKGGKTERMRRGIKRLLTERSAEFRGQFAKLHRFTPAQEKTEAQA